MQNRIITSFLLRALLSMFILLLAGGFFVVEYMKHDYEKGITSRITTYIDKLSYKYELPLEKIYIEKGDMIEEDAKGLMKEMGFLLLEIYDKNHNELFELHSNSKRYKELLAMLTTKHDDLIIHDFPIERQINYNFFETEGETFTQIFYQVLNSKGEKVGYIEGISLVDRIVVEQFKRSVATTLITVILSVLLLSLALFPLIYIAYKELKNKQIELLYSNIQTIKSLGNAVAQRDSDTDEHNYRVTIYSVYLAQELQLDGEEMKKLIKGSFLHDVGKIGISDSILLKPGKLTEEEFAIMKGHVAKGVEIIDEVTWLDGSEDVIAYHHEKYNGKGYDKGLSGEEIPQVARIFAVIDVFDALTSRRPYKEPMSFEKSLSIIKEESGEHFDPKIVAAFEKIAEEIHEKIATKSKKELKELLLKLIDRYFL